jgi:hypothetical protein
VSKERSRWIGATGCVVIENLRVWRMDPGVPPVVPEVEAHASMGFGEKHIIANPNLRSSFCCIPPEGHEDQRLEFSARVSGAVARFFGLRLLAEPTRNYDFVAASRIGRTNGRS